MFQFDLMINDEMKHNVRLHNNSDRFILIIIVLNKKTILLINAKESS